MKLKAGLVTIGSTGSLIALFFDSLLEKLSSIFVFIITGFFGILKVLIALISITFYAFPKNEVLLLFNNFYFFHFSNFSVCIYLKETAGAF